MLLQTEPWGKPGAQPMFSSHSCGLLASTLTQYSSGCSNRPFRYPSHSRVHSSRNSFQAPDIKVLNWPIFPLSSQPPWLSSHSLLPLFIHLTHYLTNIYWGLYWLECFRIKDTGNWLARFETIRKIIISCNRMSKLQAKGPWLCFSGIHLALPSSVCCHCPWADSRVTRNHGPTCSFGYI